MARTYLPFMNIALNQGTNLATGQMGPLVCEEPRAPAADAQGAMSDLHESLGNAACLENMFALAPAPSEAEDWLTWGNASVDWELKQRAKTSHVPAQSLLDERRSRAMDEASYYEALLADRRAERHALASADRAAGLSSEATVADDRYTRVNDAVRAFTHMALPGGGLASAPYQINIHVGNYLDREHTVMSGEHIPAEQTSNLGWLQTGRATADEIHALLTGTAQDEAWTTLTNPAGDKARLAKWKTDSQSEDPEVRKKAGKYAPGPEAQERFSEKRQGILPDGASPAVTEAANVMAAAQTAGLGVDCAGFVQLALAGAGLAPPEVLEHRGPNVLGCMDGLGTRMGKKGVRETSPLDGQQQLRLQPGDMMQIADRKQRADGHIALITAAEDLGDEVVVRYAHSTDNQDVMSGEGRVGTRAEGAREDLIVYNKVSGEWRTVRGAFSSQDLDKNRIQGFSRPDLP